MTTRILLRAPKDPFESVSAERTYLANLIGTNSGNLVFLEAAHKLLGTRDATITPDRFAPHKLGADRINERFDVYVVALANAFRSRFEPALARMTRVIERLRIPVVVLGVGAQAPASHDTEHLERMRPAIEASCARCSTGARAWGSGASSPPNTCADSAFGTWRSSAARPCSSTATG